MGPDDFFTRRAFLGALAASVVAAGAPLPEGLLPEMGVGLAGYRDVGFSAEFTPHRYAWLSLRQTRGTFLPSDYPVGRPKP